MAGRQRSTDSGQVTATAAAVYDAFFVPAIFQQWPARIVARAGLAPGMRVLDVACGTGVLALEAARAVQPGGAVAGVDLNPGMLAVARSKAPEIAWQEAPAEELPFETGGFDAAISQFGLMFFSDRIAALSEMSRVVHPGGPVVAAVWDALENAPGYAAVTRLLARLFGERVADRIRSPYSLGDAVALGALFAEAGLDDVRCERVSGKARFPSIRAWLHSDVRGWTLADEIDDEQFEHLVAEAETELCRFARPDGSVTFAHPALVASAVARRAHS